MATWLPRSVNLRSGTGAHLAWARTKRAGFLVCRRTRRALMQEVLINAIYQDRAIDPWSPPVFDARKRDAGLDWPHQALTMIGRIRLRSLRECCECVLRRRIPGDFVETGVWRRGACIMVAAVVAAYESRIRKVWGFDSFQGLPPPNEVQYPGDRGDRLHRFPQLAVSLEEVTENFRRIGLWSDQVRLVKGWFADTVPTAPIERIAVLRLDGDLYESTIQVLEGFYSRLSPGGFCIIDDYGAMLSCRSAVEDFRRQRGAGEAMAEIPGAGSPRAMLTRVSRTSGLGDVYCRIHLLPFFDNHPTSPRSAWSLTSRRS